ncbi:polyphenol oxidase I, chloroplastic-like protein, partial [Tanacetum coccineum]
ALPDDDPRSFNNQAKLHCAYSNGIYPLNENGEPERKLKIHNSWLFFPFHRWYLYFFERILGELINDSTFALPYWNWDNALYDSYRNPNHRRPAVVDLDYGAKDRYISRVDQIRINLALMNRQMIRNAADTVSFFGGHEIVSDDGIPLVDSTVGSIEGGCHTGMHLWVGNSDTPNNEDMGSLLSAGYDPLFYVHHMSTEYSVNVENLGYEYEVSETPWTKYVPQPRCNKSGGVVTRAKTVSETQLQINPPKINEIVNVHVPRPANHKFNLSTKEILVIDKVKYNVKKLVKFNINFNGCDEHLTTITPRDSEYAGCFTKIPETLGDERFEDSGVKLE